MMQAGSAWEAPRTTSDAQQGGLGRLDCKQQTLDKARPVSATPRRRADLGETCGEERCVV